MVELFTYNFRFFLIIILFWLILLENAFSFGVLFSLGNGLEFKFSLIIRSIVLISCLDLFFKGKMLKKELRPVTYLIIIMILFLIYGYLLFPQYVIRSLSVTIQTISILLIIPFLFHENSKRDGCPIFFKQLRIFALFNAACVICSYFFPNAIEAFESSSLSSDVGRSFGIMGDEIAIFLTFFILDSIHNKFWKSFVVFTLALLLTGSIGASFTFACSLIFYMYKSNYISIKNVVYIIFFLIASMIIGYFYFDDILQLSLFKRIDENLFHDNGNSANLRLLSYETGLEILKEYPFFGVGFGVYGAVIADSYGYLSQSEIIIMSATYNQYLQVLCEMWVIGFLLFMNFIINSLKTVKDKDNTYNNRVIYSWLFMFFVTIQSANWFLPSSFVYLLLISLIAIGFIKKYNNERIFI